MGEPTPAEQAAFDRGVFSQTLTEYGQHLRAINGSTEKTAVALSTFASALQTVAAEIQTLTARLDSEAETRLAMAAALEKAESNRREQADRKWSVPMQRLSWVLTAVAALVAIYFALT